jgi:hypothetical protein
LNQRFQFSAFVSAVVFLALAISGTVQAMTQTRRALIHSVGHTDQAAEFTQVTTLKSDNARDIDWDSKITDSSGAVVMTETAHLQNGKIQTQHVEQLQIGEAYDLKVNDGQAVFTTYKIVDAASNLRKIEKLSSTSTKLTDVFLTGPPTESFLVDHLDAFLKGESVDADFGVFELERKVGFRFSKQHVDGDAIEIKMRPSNIFFSALADPIFITISQSEKRMIAFKGRTPLRKKIDGKWKPYDAEILYPKPEEGKVEPGAVQPGTTK